MSALTPGGIAEQVATNPDQHLTNFADWYHHLRLEKEEEDREYLKDLTEVVQGFVTMSLKGAGEGRHEIKIAMSEPKNGKRTKPSNEYLLNELSEGQRVLVGLYAVLHFGITPGATVCFDEPDNFIALGEVQPWLSKVLERTEDNSDSQVLIVSHHPELLNRMAFKEGLLLDRPAGRHTRVRPFDDPSQTGLSAAELVSRGWERE